MNWADICNDPLLENLPYRMETDRWGNLVMSPPPSSGHNETGSEIAYRLRQLMGRGLAFQECPIETSEGVRVADVVWVSQERRKSRPNRPAYQIAPEICVEVFSPSNTTAQMEERKLLFFAHGALEFWSCSEAGEMRFFSLDGEIAQSKVCPEFPATIQLQ